MRAGEILLHCRGVKAAPAPASSVVARPLLLRVGSWLLVVAVCVAFGAGWRAPFTFDDTSNLAQNRLLRDGRLVEFVVREPADPGSTLAGRPLARLTLAANRAVGGHSAASYRVGNLLLHAAGAVLLLGVLRRIFGRVAADGGLPAARVEAAALAGAAVWALHPLQTAAVVYVVQRVELQAAVLMLASVLAFLRWREGAGPGWGVAAVIAAGAAAGTKETAVVLPVAIWMLDRSLGGGGARPVRERPVFYAGLAASWLWLAALVAVSGGRGGTAGFDAGVSAWRYLCTQAEGIVTYLQLAVWPSPLVFDYGTWLAAGLGEVWWQAALVAGLAVAALAGGWRGRWWGVAGTWFFLLLAPTSSIVPVASQTIAEHRVYLALAGPVALAVALGARWIRRGPAVVALVVVALLAGLTVRRSLDYRSELGLWGSALEVRPDNARGRINLALALQDAGQLDAALAQFDRVIRQDATLVDAHYNRGLLLARLGRVPEARESYGRALALSPRHPEALNNLGNLEMAAGRAAEAARAYAAAAEAKPDFAEAHSNLAVVLLDLGRGADALAHAQRAVALEPDLGEAQFSLGNALAAARRLPEARTALERAASLVPDNADVRNNLATVLVELGQLDAALGHYDVALRLRPAFPQALRNSATILAMQGRRREALERFERLLALNPSDAQAADAVRRLRGGG